MTAQKTEVLPGWYLMTVLIGLIMGPTDNIDQARKWKITSDTTFPGTSGHIVRLAIAAPDDVDALDEWYRIGSTNKKIWGVHRTKEEAEDRLEFLDGFSPEGAPHHVVRLKIVETTDA